MSEVESKVPQLRFPEFNVGWSEYRLGSITDVVDSLHTTPKDYVSSGFPMIRVVDVNNIELDLNKCLNVSEETYRQFTKKYQPKVGDVVLSRVGTCGASIMLRTKDNVCLGQNTVLLHPKINKDFYHTLVKSNIFQVQVSRRVVGSTQKTLSLKDLKLFKLNIPTKPEQQKIAAFLTEVDNKIEQLSKKQELLGEYKKGLMQKIFSQAIRFKADDGSEFPDWKNSILSDYLEINATYGIVKAGDFLEDGIKMLRGGDIKNGQINLTKLPYVSKDIAIEYKRTTLKQNDVVIALVGYPGEAAVIPECLIGHNISRAVGLLRLKNVNHKFIVQYLNSYIGRKNVLRPSAGSAQQVVNLKDLNQLKIPVPHPKEQTKIASFLSSINNKIEQVGEQLNESKQFKKALLQQMFV